MIHMIHEEFDPEKVNGHRLTLEAVERMGARLGGMTLEERGRIPALSGGREDLIIPGAALVEETMRRAGKEWMLVSDYGLREGLLMEILESFLKREKRLRELKKTKF